MPTTSSATSSTTSTLPGPVTAPRRDSHPIVQEVNRRFNASLHEDFLAAMLEFCGTVLFLLLGLGGIQASLTSSADASGAPSGAPIMSVLYSSVSMGLALLVSVWLFYRVTGGLFNPNVSFAMLLIGAINPIRFLMYVIAQFLGAIVASALLQALLPGPLEVNTVPAIGTSIVQAVFIEMFITAALVFAVLMLAAEKHCLTAFAPIGIGLTLFSGELFALDFTGGSMNTARSFGPAVMTSFGNSHWVYWLGPTLGSVLAAVFYKILKTLNYERLSPGQDGTTADVLSLPTNSQEKLTAITSVLRPASPPPLPVLGGINALRLQTQTASVNGRRVLVGYLPLGGIDTGKIVPGEAMNLTILFEPQGVQSSASSEHTVV